MQNILVTGSNGFIGGYIVEYLKNKGYYIIGLGRKDVSTNQVDKYIQMDLEKPDFQKSLKDIQVDAIVHCAANMSHEENPENIIQVNCIGTQKLLEYAVANNISAYIQISSLPLIGKPIQNPIQENHPIDPPTFYHITKRMEELIAEHTTKMHGLRTVSFRISAPWGIGMNENTILPVFVKNAINNKDIVLFGKGSRIQNFIHVKDIANAVYLALNSTAQGVYNMCGDFEYSNLELANKIIETLHSTSKVAFNNKEDIFDDYYFNVSYKKANSDFGFVPMVNFEEELMELSNYFMKGEKE